MSITHTSPLIFFFFLNDTAPPEIYPLPLHDALPISRKIRPILGFEAYVAFGDRHKRERPPPEAPGPYSHLVRSEEHTSELQSRLHLVCRLLLEKKKQKIPSADHHQSSPMPLQLG